MIAKARALMSLGASNLLRVGVYRLGVRSRIHPAVRLKADVPQGPYYAPTSAAPVDLPAPNIWRDSARLFSHQEFPLTEPPEWHVNLAQPGKQANASRHWSLLGDYDPDAGDIKCYWELSRFEWLLAMAQRYRCGEDGELARMNMWLQDWCTKNPPYFGVNWKCGQEASIRVLRLALASLVLGQVKKPLPGLVDLLRVHLRRIAPTMAYAIGQDNNHGTSEAAALFVGGTWLQAAGHGDGTDFAAIGTKWLEDRARHLILEDGTFSQFSTTYHRLMLETYCLAEVWRRHMGVTSFSETLHDRLRHATQWLRHLVAPESGDAPNLGNNDGALLLPLSDSPFRDFRPALQLAANLFFNARAIAAEGKWDEPARWLGLAEPSAVMEPVTSRSFDAGGIHVLRHGGAMACLRYPRFRFRPAHADALHVELWLDGQNLLADAGTFGYAASAEDTGYFMGTTAHNTVMFDGRDQMPRVGRYMFGNWLQATDVSPVQLGAESTSATAAYQDNRGNFHKRRIVLSDRAMRIEDSLKGPFNKAVMRWRLPRAQSWRLCPRGAESETMAISVDTPDSGVKFEIEEGFQSLHYLEKQSIQVLKITLQGEQNVVTKVRF